MKYRDEVFKAIKSKTSKSFDENTIIRDLGLDSIDMVEMIADFEDTFGFSIPSSKVNSIKTIKDILDFLDELSK